MVLCPTTVTSTSAPVAIVPVSEESTAPSESNSDGIRLPRSIEIGGERVALRPRVPDREERGRDDEYPRPPPAIAPHQDTLTATAAWKTRPTSMKVQSDDQQCAGDPVRVPALALEHQQSARVPRRPRTWCAGRTARAAPPRRRRRSASRIESKSAASAPDPQARELEEERDAAEDPDDGDDAQRAVIGAEDREHGLIDELAADLQVAVVGDEAGTRASASRNGAGVASPR